MSNTLVFKVVVLGEGTSQFIVGRVGKTSMSLKFVDGKFDDNQQSTINASYLEKSVTLKNGKTVRLAIWVTHCDT
jgi:Ras-related protein Rab-21